MMMSGSRVFWVLAQGRIGGWGREGALRVGAPRAWRLDLEEGRVCLWACPGLVRGQRPEGGAVEQGVVRGVGTDEQHGLAQGLLF